MKRSDDRYEEALKKYIRGEATSKEVSRVDPVDSALRKFSERAYNRAVREASSPRIGRAITTKSRD